MLINVYSSIKAITQSKKRVMAFFSSGKDSVVTLDLIARNVKDFQIVHFYYYKNLSIRESVLRFYEKKYGKEIIRLPHPERSWFFKHMGQQVKTNLVINDTEPMLRKKYGCEYFAYGHRIAESLTRRAMLSKFRETGIDEKTGRVYPVLHFKKRHILEYIKQNKLLLPPDYDMGFHDVNIFKGDALLWLYNSYRDDYNQIKSEFPFIEEDLKKAQWESKE